jgi:hypothetical protein
MNTRCGANWSEMLAILNRCEAALKMEIPG